VSGHDSRPLLAEVMARHLFTVRLDGEGEWYRHHALFRRFLLRRIAASGRARVRDLHRRAARAWMAAGSPTEAARHLLEAGDHAEAADALEPVAEMLLMTPEADGLASDL